MKGLCCSHAPASNLPVCIRYKGNKTDQWKPFLYYLQVMTECITHLGLISVTSITNALHYNSSFWHDLKSKWYKLYFLLLYDTIINSNVAHVKCFLIQLEQITKLYMWPNTTKGTSCRQSSIWDNEQNSV